MGKGERGRVQGRRSGYGNVVALYRLDLEVQSDQGEHQAFEILHEVVEAAQALRVARLVHVQQGAGLRGGERYVLVADHDLQLLAAHPVRLRPERVVLLHDLRVLDDALELLHHALVDVRFLAYHCVVLVVGVVGVA